MKNLGIKLLFGANVLLAIGDFVVTGLNPNKTLFESNILYTYTHSFVLICAINVVILGLMYFYYFKYNSNVFKYTIINELVILLFVRVMALKNGIILLTNKPVMQATIEMVQAHPEVIQQTTQQNAYIMLLSLASGLVAFIVWWFDYRRNNQCQKNKK